MGAVYRTWAGIVQRDTNQPLHGPSVCSQPIRPDRLDRGTFCENDDEITLSMYVRHRDEESQIRYAYAIEALAASGNYQGGSVAGAHLRDLGHDKPAYVAAPSFNPRVHDSRMRGFADAFSGTNVPVIKGELGRDGGYESGRRSA